MLARMRAMRAVWAMVVLALSGLVLWGGPVTSLWERTFARPCPAGDPASSCLRTVSGRVDRFNDVAEGDVDLSLTLARPVAALTGRGVVDVTFTPEAADRMGLGWDSHDVPVTATLFGTDVAAITGPNGVTEESTAGETEALFRLLVASAAAILAVAGAGLLWRRIRGGKPGWIRRAAVCTTVGSLVGAAAGRAFGALDVAWIMPAAFVTMAVVSTAGLLVRLPRAWIRQDEETVSDLEYKPAPA
jgi:hypothetical protein